MYGHSIAVLALCEVRGIVEVPRLAEALQQGASFLCSARNPYGAWRYDCPPTGDNDTSVTAWALRALCAARDAGARIDPDALVGGRTVLDEFTDPATQRCGYDSIGSESSRVNPAPGVDPALVNERFHPSWGEAMTAAAITCRMLLGESRTGQAVAGGLKLVASQPPTWDPDAGKVDVYAWYYGTLAQRAGKDKELWPKWRALTLDALLAGQVKDGGARGSWSPAQDCWGCFGGRVYSTSLACLTLHELLR